MENPKVDIVRTVLPALLTTDIGNVNRTIDTYISQDAVFAHPWFTAKGKDEFRKIYLGWSKQNLLFKDITVLSTWWDPDTMRLVTDIEYSFRPLLFSLVPTSWVGLQRARVITIMDCRAVKRNGVTKYIITRQEDYYPTDRIVGAATVQPFSRFTLAASQQLLRLMALLTVYLMMPLSFVLSTVVETLGVKRIVPKTNLA
ncbi:hypothetical protein HDU85_003361 [Gaertneriomyces sp. JEL0708]|nr:hypothetical protein HDU85_003361 [Gaertneriomyces sp. JEL0708]